MKLQFLELTPDELSKITELANNPPKPSERLKLAYTRYKQYTEKVNKS